MYASCLLEKEAGMYPGTLRSPGGDASAGTGGTEDIRSLLQAFNFGEAPGYAHYMGYSHMPSMESSELSLEGWDSPYSAPREDWTPYPRLSSTMGVVPMGNMTPSPAAFGSPDYSNLGYPGHGSGGGSLPDSAGGQLICSDMSTMDASSPSRSRHSSYSWMCKTVQVTGKTRTKEKYRVVYTDHQRLELEKEYHDKEEIRAGSQPGPF